MSTTEESTITVSGTGRAAAAPDVATVHVGISLVRSTVAEVTAEGSRLASDLVTRLRSEGLGDDDLQTSNYSVRAEHDHSRQPSRPIGYRLDNTLDVVVQDLDSLARLLDLAAQAGGDATTIGGIDFHHSDPDQLRSSARAAAWADGRARAEQLAELAGTTLGEARSIVEGTAAPGGPMRAATMMADSAPPIEAGTVDVQVNLTIEFAIR